MNNVDLECEIDRSKEQLKIISAAISCNDLNEKIECLKTLYSETGICSIINRELHNQRNNRLEEIKILNKLRK